MFLLLCGIVNIYKGISIYIYIKEDKVLKKRDEKL